MRRNGFTFARTAGICLLSTALPLAGMAHAYAFLSDTEAADNLLETGYVTVEPDEDFTPPSSIPLCDSDEYAPATYQKEVRIENTSNTDVWIRARINYDTNIYQNGGFSRLCMGSSTWTYNADDGFYYCTTPIAPGDSTPNLITGVEFGDLNDASGALSSSDHETYEDVVYMWYQQYFEQSLEEGLDIYVYAEAVAVGSHGDAESAFAAISGKGRG